MTVWPKPRARSRQAGLTLVEMLVVMTIIGLLSAVLLMRVFSGAARDADEFSAEAFIRTVSASLESYKADRRYGVYPPTSIEGTVAYGKPGNRTNLGIEALVVALSSPGYSGEKIIDRFEQYRSNIDGDQSKTSLTIHKARDLWEVLDPWHNPYAYFSAVDYENKQVRQYLAASEEEVDDYHVVVAKPWINPKTKSFYNATTFQLFSAGPDGVFNTEDDIGNW